MFAGASLDENSGAFCELKANFFRLILTKAELLKLILQIQKKIQKNKELHQIADEVEEEVIKIQPIYEAIKEHPEADKEEIYKMLK